MKHKSIILLRWCVASAVVALLAFSTHATAQVPIDDTNFPDQYFRAWVLANYDDGPGHLDGGRERLGKVAGEGEDLEDDRPVDTPQFKKELSELNPAEFMLENNLNANQTVNILCASGARASQAAEKFEKAGYTNVAVIIGGMVEAEYEGLEIIRH